MGALPVPFRIAQSGILARLVGEEGAMAYKYWEHRSAWDFYRMPDAAQTAFRQVVRAARCGEEKAVEAFVEAGVTDLMRPVVTLHDLVIDGLAELPADARPEVERVLFGQFIGQTSPIRLVRQVLDRARLDGLNDRQIAGAVTVVLESHGLLQRDPA
jgi:hypothetical protein